MTERTSSAVGRSGRKISFRRVRNVFPLTVANLLILRAKTAIFLHGENRAQWAAHESAVLVQYGITVIVVDAGKILEQQYGTVWKVPRLIRIDVHCRIVRPDNADLPVVVVVQSVQLVESVLIIGREANAIRGGSR